MSKSQTGRAAGDDHWHNLAGFIRTCVSFRAGVLGVVAGTFPIINELIATANQANQLASALLGPAQAAGAVRPDETTVDLWEVFYLFSRRQPGDDERSARVLAIMLDGLRPTGQPFRSPPAPSWEATAQVWDPR